MIVLIVVIYVVVVLFVMVIFVVAVFSVFVTLVVNIIIIKLEMSGQNPGNGQTRYTGICFSSSRPGQ